MILVDTSGWVEFLRATGSPTHVRVRRLVDEGVAVATTDVVMMEVLAGATDDEDHGRLRRLLARCRSVGTRAPSDYEQAADLYRRCRRSGFTIRKLPDCLIAVVAMRSELELLHVDQDFDAIAQCAPLRIA